MNNFLLSLFFLVCYAIAGVSQTTISGYVEDAATGEKLIGATVLDELSGEGTISNTYGFFSLTLKGDRAQMVASYLGYISETAEVRLEKDTKIDFKLNQGSLMEEVEIVAEKYERIEEETQMSKIEVPVEQIKRIPALLGEVDVMKALQLLPGVQSGGEGQTGLYVRGGSPDQNLVLLDGVPIYNASHVLGIFSVFNADAIKNVTLTKGGFPARFGGRLSSVLEINMKDGNMQEFHGEGSIGAISSKLTLEGPIIKGKTSYLISGRRTYADLLARPFIALANRNNEQDFKLGLHFYDLNAKINHKINDKHRLYLSLYNGSDVFSNEVSEDEFKVGGGIRWGNLISSLRWNYQINPRLFANTTLTYSKYDITFDVFQEDSFNGLTQSFSAIYQSGIEDYGAKVDFDFIPSPRHYIRFGAGTTRHRYDPGAIAFDISVVDTTFTFGNDPFFSFEHDVYIEDDIQLGAFKANVGLHGSIFDTDEKTYVSVQPRLGLRYLISNKTSLKASFSTMTQNINLLTSEALSLPTDLWVPSTARIKPQRAWQVAAGFAKSFGKGFEFSTEVYYKSMKDVISFKPGASFLFDFNSDWQDKVTQGTGEAYGLELFLQKKQGNTTGWIGYTLAWNNRTFDEINGGETFPFRYDRRHDVSVVLSHQLTKKWNLSTAWIYGTGNAISLPIYKYSIADINGDFFNTPQIESLGDKNGFRMSDYHRLDLGAEWKGNPRPNGMQFSWVFGVYNAYWHRNPYYTFADSEAVYDEDGNFIGTEPVFREISILPIIPSISFGVKF